MKKNILMLVAALVSSSLTGACTAPTADSSEDVAQETQEMRLMNGSDLSGVALVGASANGATLDGVQFTGIELAGVELREARLNGTVLSAELPNGTVLAGADLIGATLVGVLTDGTQVTLRIDDVVATADADILNYRISHVDERGLVTPVCGYDASGAENMGYPLAGRYDQSVGTATGGSFIDDASQFTIACKGAALAKCAELGYKPFKTATECNSLGQCHSVSLAPVHQACVRMVRADYCGDGASHTYKGTEIDVSDTLRIKNEDASVAGSIEAEWGVDGATCVLHTRWVSAEHGDVAQYMQDHCPARYTPVSSTCGRTTSTFNTDVGYSVSTDDRALLRNRSVVHQ